MDNIYKPDDKQLKFQRDQGLFLISYNGPQFRLQVEDFERPGCGNFIAHGTFGNVYKTRSEQLNTDVALKSAVLKGYKDDISQGRHISRRPWVRELRFLTDPNTHHKHLIWCYGYFFPAGKSLFLYLELMECSFKEILYAFNLDPDEKQHHDLTPFRTNSTILEKVVWAFLKQTSSGLNYLHKQGLMHRDVKPGNILLKIIDSGAIIKLGDFGAIREIGNDVAMLTDNKDTVDESNKETVVGTDELGNEARDSRNGLPKRSRCLSVCPGTTYYSAPEVLNDVRTHYTESCDVWSLSVTVLILTAGYNPVSELAVGERSNTSESTDKVFQRNIFNEDLTFDKIPSEVGFEGDLARVLSGCLEKEPEERPKISSIKELCKEQFSEKNEDFLVLGDWFKNMNKMETIEYNRNQESEMLFKH